MSLELSIIIPTYNSSNTIKSALISILQQKFNDFEILIIDACSIDSTLDIVKSFNDERIIIISERDEGVYDAMNKGMRLAKGKWLYFLGSDDELNSNNVLEKVFNVINYNKEICVLYGNVQFNNGLPFWANNNKTYDGEFTFEKLMDQNICHQSIFYKREFIFCNKLSYSLKYPICADWDFNLRAWLKSSFIYIDLIIANFNDGGLSSIQTDNFYKDKDWLIAKCSGKKTRYFYNKVLNYSQLIFKKLKQ